MGNGTVDSEVVGKWIIDLVKAVHHIHSKGFFHRRILNGNVMVTHDDHILLGGLDTIIDAEQSDYGFCNFSMSPECLECELKERATYDRKHDVWLLGWLLFEICNKRLPFTPVKEADE